jgi:hypothetical protein
MACSASSPITTIGDRWPDTLATQPPLIKVVRPNNKRHRRSSTPRRSEPLYQTQRARAVEGNLGGFCVCAAMKNRNGATLVAEHCGRRK